MTLCEGILKRPETLAKGRPDILWYQKDILTGSTTFSGKASRVRVRERSGRRLPQSHEISKPALMSYGQDTHRPRTIMSSLT